MTWKFAGSSPLFIQGHQDVERPLSAGGTPITDKITSTGTLFIRGPVSDTTYVPLYVLGEDKKPTSSTALYVNGIFGNTDTAPLFVRGAWINTSPLPCFIRGDSPNSNNITLFVNGEFVSVNTVPLSVNGFSVGSDTTPLYLQGAVRQNDSVNLSLSGYGRQTSSTTLFIGLPLLSSNNRTTLFISGGQLTTRPQQAPLHLFAGDNRCETMNLYIQALPIPSLSTFSNLSVTGLNGNGQFKAIPLQIIGREMGQSMNLVIQGKDSGGQSRIIRLVISGRQPNAYGATPLVIANHTESYSDPTTALFIKGLGVNPGYIPVGESMGLYVQRGPYDGITLHIQNNGNAGSVPLHIIGAPSIHNNTSLTIIGLGGTTSSSTPCLTVGGIFTSSNASATIAVPRVVGFESETAFLFTSGFEY